MFIKCKYVLAGLAIAGASLFPMKNANAEPVNVNWTQVYVGNNAEADYPGVDFGDLKYTDSPIAKLYHIEKTPFFFLLNREGQIVSKNSSIDIVGNEIYKLFKHI